MIDIGIAAVIGGSVVLGCVSIAANMHLYRNRRQLQEQIVSQTNELRIQQVNRDRIDLLGRRNLDLERQLAELRSKLSASEERRREVEQDYLSSSSWSSSKSEQSV